MSVMRLQNNSCGIAGRNGRQNFLEPSNASAIGANVLRFWPACESSRHWRRNDGAWRTVRTVPGLALLADKAERNSPGETSRPLVERASHQRFEQPGNQNSGQPVPSRVGPIVGRRRLGQEATTRASSPPSTKTFSSGDDLQVVTQPRPFGFLTAVRFSNDLQRSSNLLKYIVLTLHTRFRPAPRWPAWWLL